MSFNQSNARFSKPEQKSSHQQSKSRFFKPEQGNSANRHTAAFTFSPERDTDRRMLASLIARVDDPVVARVFIDVVEQHPELKIEFLGAYLSAQEAIRRSKIQYAKACEAEAAAAAAKAARKRKWARCARMVWVGLVLAVRWLRQAGVEQPGKPQPEPQKPRPQRPARNINDDISDVEPIPAKVIVLSPRKTGTNN